MNEVEEMAKRIIKRINAEINAMKKHYEEHGNKE